MNHASRLMPAPERCTNPGKVGVHPPNSPAQSSPTGSTLYSGTASRGETEGALCQNIPQSSGQGPHLTASRCLFKSLLPHRQRWHFNWDLSHIPAQFLIDKATCTGVERLEVSIHMQHMRWAEHCWNIQFVGQYFVMACTSPSQTAHIARQREEQTASRERSSAKQQTWQMQSG
ncbi:uncharacterized protein LOC120372175 isoform X7 [Mauremys reevesii]|nr:uncharacterized protein LOC120372175 isoform X7 [Mauremys reevesii]XP_039344974.1 uncharacterized protein LOC120372175 isoform X7 [Mauremys reevesii]XP_039344975.1 uncharacterized protein LOC120372175 isoform X7 [Mauremys reevesii]